jgi:hypothetical protein
MLETPKFNDSIEKITSINEKLYKKYNRHHVLTDTIFLFDPTIDPKSYFAHVEDINGNQGTTFKVLLGFDSYVLEKMPQYFYENENEYMESQFEKWVNEMEVSYELEDSNFTNIRKVHHIFIKLMYNPRQQVKYYCIWTLKEYFEGDDVLNFDYNVTFRGHGKGKLISMKAAKKFAIELFTVFIQLLKKGYIPYRFNDTGIIIRYKDDNIEWKFVEYLYFRKEELTSSNIVTFIDNFRSLLCWRVCEYTNKKNDPFWILLRKLLDVKYNHYTEIGQKEYQKYMKEEKNWNMNFPVVSHKEFIFVFETILETIKYEN